MTEKTIEDYKLSNPLLVSSNKEYIEKWKRRASENEHFSNNMKKFFLEY